MFNVLTNQQFNSWPELRVFYQEFFRDTDHIEWFSEPREYRRLRLVTNQYCYFRDQVRYFDTLEQISHWLNYHGHEVLMVPMNFVDNRRILKVPLAVTISQVEANPSIDFCHRSLLGLEEDVQGSGWSFIMTVVPGSPSRWDSGAWRIGLAAYGIYLKHGEWVETPSEDRVWEFEGLILDRDFAIKDADDPRWVHVDSLPDEDEELSSWELANEAAAAIEEGFDFDVDDDGYAR